MSLPGSKKKKPRGPAKSPKEVAQDDQVMLTNSSSIVSKRSVEKLYYPDEPHFFRYFVKKFQRRSPLINRGYHIRLHVIDVVVRDFLRCARPDGKTKVVINLGCGSDVLPWQCLTRYPQECAGGRAKFVDVDFPDLIKKKRQTVFGTPELSEPLTGLESVEGAAVVLKSAEYAQIGCDLRDLKSVQDALGTVVDMPNCVFLFVAEVSITYMETEGADRVIQWASTIGDAEFCLLEQILPDGPDHPFAKTMLSHFEKLNTPIKSVDTYSTLAQQHDRFASRGWKTVDTWTLWQAWANSRFLSADDRRKLDAVEPFDEWEEFALFGGHYCLVHASTTNSTSAPTEFVAAKETRTPLAPADIPTKGIRLQCHEGTGKKVQRRFGASKRIRSYDDPLGIDTEFLVNFMGLGATSRLESYDVFGPEKTEHGLSDLGTGPASRMCHTLTHHASDSSLLVGGRGAPSSPLKDCWSLDGSSWTREKDLPRPLYRHSAASLRYCDGESPPMTLIIGGKDGASSVFDGAYFFYSLPGRGVSRWLSCKIVGEDIVPVSGAFLVSIPGSKGSHFSGIYGGGIKDDGVLSEKLYSWSLDISDYENPVFALSSLKMSSGAGESHGILRTFARYGAVCIPVEGSNNRDRGDGPLQFSLLGGVTKDHLLPGSDEIIQFGVERADGYLWQITNVSRLVDEEMLKGSGISRPLLVGASVETTRDGQVVILGGGATCFSMGTFWNNSASSFSIGSHDDIETETPTTPSSTAIKWELCKTVNMSPSTTASSRARQGQQMSNGLSGDGPQKDIKEIPRVTLSSAEDFARIIQDGQPAILTGLDIGTCVSAWNLDYIVDKVGADHKAVIHDSSTANMDFNKKNFKYVTTTFGEFASRVKSGDKLYLRALSQDQPADQPADLAIDFPALAPDFVLPAPLSFVTANLFSSVLRISGPVNMWLHYDVMANIYAQVAGTKRLLLFPPADVEHLGFAPGASSSSADVFSAADDPALARTHPHEAVLGPGEVLFLPPLWLHAATPTAAASIAVNVFFRDLEVRGGGGGGAYAAGRDVYGNRDLAAYEKGRQDVARMAKAFEKLPSQAREFYLLRLAEELRGRATRE